MNIGIVFITIFAFLLPISLHMMERWLGKNLNIVTLLLIICFLCLPFYMGSRTGIISMIATTILYYKQQICNLKALYKILILLCLLFIVSSLVLYRLGSVYGRILIYIVMIKAIMNNPLWGYGWNSMYKHYMEHQADFFNKNPDSFFVFYADNNYFPFNEFLGMAYRYGIPSLIITSIISFLFLRKCRHEFRCSFFSLCIICMFSYPFSYNPYKNRAEKMYHIAATLSSAARYNESNIVLNRCAKYVHNYDIELLYGNNALQLRQFDDAIMHFSIAHKMVPTRFYPLYGLFLCYKQTSNKKSYALAEEIINKPIKVPSHDIDIILDEMYFHLSYH